MIGAGVGVLFLRWRAAVSPGFGKRFTQVLFNSGGAFTWQGRGNRHILNQVLGGGLLRFLAPV